MGILLIYVRRPPRSRHGRARSSASLSTPEGAPLAPSELDLPGRPTSAQDVTSTKTWSNIRNWVRNIEANAPQTVNKILIGNKRAAGADASAGPPLERRPRRGLLTGSATRAWRAAEAPWRVAGRLVGDRLVGDRLGRPTAKAKAGGGVAGRRAGASAAAPAAGRGRPC